MVFLDEVSIQTLTPDEAKAEALKYSNLCKANMAVIKVLETQIGRLTKELGATHQLVIFSQEQLNELRKKTFGRSSEIRNDFSPNLTALPLFSSLPAEENPICKCSGNCRCKKKKKPRKQFGRTQQPELPTREVIHTVDEKIVSEKELIPLKDQFETSTVITIVPTQFIVETHKRQKYIKIGELLPEHRTILTAPGPLKLSEGARYSLNFGIHVGIQKYQFHAPLERQVKLMETQGLIVRSNVLFDQVDMIAFYLKNSFISQLKSEVLQSQLHIADETYWLNLGKNEDVNKRFWCWGVHSGKAILFEIYDSRSQKVASQFLKGITGVLLTDGYKVYQNLPPPTEGTLILANDWAHPRRKFVAAEKNFPLESKFFLAQIQALFLIEQQIKTLSLEDRLKARQQNSKIITDAIHSKLIELKNMLPQSSLGKAINYTLNLWRGLTLFLDHPIVPLDSNSIEREMRPPVLGRNNHHGSHSLETAEVAAIWYSLVATCKLHKIDSRFYLETILPLILQGKKFPMPWDFKVTPKISSGSILDPIPVVHPQFS
jgi:transposase